MGRQTRGRGRGSRGARGTGRGSRGGGRGKKAKVLSSDDEEISQDQLEQISPSDSQNSLPPQASEEQEEIGLKKENEIVDPPEETTSLEVPIIEAPPPLQPQQTLDMDISQLEAPTFTTISRGPPEPMLRLKWDHKVSLIGEKVLNPMIHCCDQCDKPILVYGRMIPCKHIFCLKCARAEPVKQCPRCKDKVVRVEQSGLGTVFMCIHGGSRYGSTGCRRTYLSQRDLQAHINHRHVTQIQQPAPVLPQQVEQKNPQPRKTSESQSAVSTPAARPQQIQQQGSQQPRSTPSTINANAGRANPIQDAQVAISKINIQPQQVQKQQHISQQNITVPPPPLNHLHGPPPPPNPELAAYYSTAYSMQQSYAGPVYAVPPVQSIITQNYGSIPSSGLMMPQMQTPPSQSGAFYQTTAPPQFGQQFTQMPPPNYQYDPSNQHQQHQHNQWNQQFYR